MIKFRSIEMCIAIAAGIVTFVFIFLAGMLPFARYMWVGFLTMIVYFSTGAQSDSKTYLRVAVSYICGLLWGQLSNQIYIHVFPVNPLLTLFLDCFVMIFVMILMHVMILGKTKANFIPPLFLGFAVTVAFWGRPFPQEGLGLFGHISAFKGLGILIFYCFFGLAFAFAVEILTGLLASRILPAPAGGQAAASAE